MLSLSVKDSPTLTCALFIALIGVVVAGAGAYATEDGQDGRDLQNFGDNELLTCLTLFFPISPIFCPFAYLLNLICNIIGPLGFCETVLN